MIRKRSFAQFILFLPVFSGCASMQSMLGLNESNTVKPIANPFSDYHAGAKGDPAQAMVLRTKKGDRSVELEIPGDTQLLSDFVLPISPAFKDSNRASASQMSGGVDGVDESYKNRTPSYSDHEITHNFPQGLPEDDGKRREIEQGLSLAPSEDATPSEGAFSYLAALDHIKQLYKASRYEAALLETDEMLKKYQTDAKLYEMRGTLLERMGKRNLALKSWNQALRFNPKDESLRRFVERKPAGLE